MSKSSFYAAAIRGVQNQERRAGATTADTGGFSQDDLSELRQEHFRRAGYLPVLRSADAVFIKDQIYSEADPGPRSGKRAAADRAEFVCTGDTG